MEDDLNFFSQKTRMTTSQNNGWWTQKKWKKWKTPHQKDKMKDDLKKNKNGGLH